MGWGGVGCAVVIRHKGLVIAERRIAADPNGSTSTMHLMQIMQIMQISKIIQIIQKMKIKQENTIIKMKKIEIL